MDTIQYSIISPLFGKEENYYEKKILNLVEELNIILTQKKVILCFYDLLDEPNRITGDIIKQKKRIKPEEYIKKIKNYLSKNNIKLHVKYRLFRSIRENETNNKLLDWFQKIGNIIADDFVLVGNYKNSILKTENALKYLCNKNPKKKYGCVIIPHRSDEYNRCLRRQDLGCSFFVSQIIVDIEFTKSEMSIFNDIKIPVYFTVTYITNKKMWNFLETLGVKSHINFEDKIENTFEKSNVHLQKIINFIRYTNNYINFEILIHSREKRLEYIKNFFKNKI